MIAKMLKKGYLFKAEYIRSKCVYTSDSHKNNFLKCSVGISC